MKFRKRVKLIPGVYLNFSGAGISTTIGVPGASININKKGTFLNTGIPGTGIYERQKIGDVENASNSNNNENSSQQLLFNEQNEIGAIETIEAEVVTTKGLQSLKQALLDCYQERINLEAEVSRAKSELKTANLILITSYILVVGLLIPWFKSNKKEKADYLKNVEGQLQNCSVNIQMDIAEEIEKGYLELLDAYKKLISCDRIWDITSSVAIDKKTSRSGASIEVNRKLVKIGFGNIAIIKSKYDALHFENANGGDIYMYPAFVAIVDSNKKFGLVDIRELDFRFSPVKFYEKEKVMSDSKVVDHAWVKVNKDGTPDQRFKDNYQIPICLYGEIEFKSKTGLNEAYSFSSFEKSEYFGRAMTNYQSIIK